MYAMQDAVTHDATAAGTRWFFRTDDHEHGPVSWEVLQGLARDGDLRPTDLVRRSDEERWLPAGQARHEEVVIRPPRTIEPAVSHRLAAALAADAAVHAVPATAIRRPARDAARADALPARYPGSAPRPGGTALLALALALVGVFQLALPLGMLSIYLGGRAGAKLLRDRGPGLYVAVTAVLTGAVDVGVSLWVLGSRLMEMHGQVAGVVP
jgi:hypothetical protein